MKHTRRLIGAMFVLASIWVFTAEVALAEETQSKALYIINGQDDNTQAVGAFVNVNGETFCTGTLVSSTAIITAAHCFEFGLDGDGFFIGSNAQDPNSGTLIPIASVHLHPTYLDDGEADIAVAILSRPATVRPIDFNRQEMNDTWVGKNLVFVGYGLQNVPPPMGEQSDNFQPKEGTRKSVEIPIVEIMPTAFKYAAQGKNTCYGDSGGPAFAQVDGKLVVVGVTSWGDETCTEFGVNTRVDTYLPFVNTYVGRAAQPGATDDNAAPVSSNAQDSDPQPTTDDAEISDETAQDRPVHQQADAPHAGCASGGTNPLPPLMLLFMLVAYGYMRRRKTQE